jgi:hypothetical protein
MLNKKAAVMDMIKMWYLTMLIKLDRNENTLAQYGGVSSMISVRVGYLFGKECSAQLITGFRDRWLTRGPRTLQIRPSVRGHVDDRFGFYFDFFYFIASNRVVVIDFQHFQKLLFSWPPR